MNLRTRLWQRSMMMILPLILIVATTVVSLSAAEDVARQRGAGDRTIAELCRGDGYKSLTKQDGTPFRNERDCIRYAMRNGGVSALATAAPTTSLRLRLPLLPPAEINVKPLPLGPATPTPAPTQAPWPAPYVTIHKWSGGVCTLMVTVTTLDLEKPYIVAVNVKQEGRGTVIYEDEVPARTYSNSYAYYLDLAPDGEPMEITAYLYEIEGDSLVQVSFDGPFFLDEKCQP